MRRDDECLDENERWARDRLEKSLGQLRVIDRSRKGGPPGLHDFAALGEVCHLQHPADSARVTFVPSS